MFPAAETDKQTETDEDAATQVIDEETLASADARNKPVNMQHNKDNLVTGGAQVNTDDLCTQVFVADVHVAGSNIAAEDGNTTAKLTDFADDLSTQVFDELSEKVEPLTSKGRKAPRGGGRTKKTGKSGLGKLPSENLDTVETQVFDSFVPPAPPSGNTRELQVDKVVDSSGDRSEMETVVTSGRRTRGRMSLKTSHRETSDSAAVNKPATTASVSETSLKTDAIPSTDDLATQVFEADAGTDEISVVPSSSGCLDSVATQVFDDIPSLRSTTGPPETLSVTKDHVAVSSGRQSNLKSNADAEDVETQVFDVVDPVVDKRNTNASWLSLRNSEAAVLVKKTYSRRTTKSVGKKQTDSSSAAEIPADEVDDVATQVFDAEPCKKLSKNSKNSTPDISHPGGGGSGTGAGKSRKSRSKPTDLMDDIATQVFDAEPCEKPSKNSKISGHGISHPGGDDSGTGAGKSRKSRGKPGSSSEAMVLPDEKLLRQTEQEDEAIESTTRDDSSKSRRLSCRANKGQHGAKSASLSAVPEESDVDQRRAGRSRRNNLKQTNPSVADDTSRSPSRDIVHDEPKTSSLAVSKDNDMGKQEVPRARGKRAKLLNSSTPDDTSEPPISVEALYRDVRVEGSTKPSDRRRQNKEVPAPVGQPGKAAQSHQQNEETDDVAKSAAEDVAATKTSGKQGGRKSKKLYTPTGLYYADVDLPSSQYQIVWTWRRM